MNLLLISFLSIFSRLHSPVAVWLGGAWCEKRFSGGRGREVTVYSLFYSNVARAERRESSGRTRPLIEEEAERAGGEDKRQQ
jgi:hypothetical protein